MILVSQPSSGAGKDKVRGGHEDQEMRHRAGNIPKVIRCYKMAEAQLDSGDEDGTRRGIFYAYCLDCQTVTTMVSGSTQCGILQHVLLSCS